MTTSVAGISPASLDVVDLSCVTSRELESFWSAELAVWRKQLDWDVTAAIASLRRAIERGTVRGKAVRDGGGAAAYSYYVIEGQRAIISSFGVTPRKPRSERAALARRLLRGVVKDLRVRGARRIETQLVSIDAPELVSCFEAEGFETHWRCFARLHLGGRRVESAGGYRATVSLLPFKAWNLSEASSLMQKAHEGGVDASMNELYQTGAGCRMLLDNIYRQKGCGATLLQASAVARLHGSDRAVGFALVTETAKGRAHLAQLAVDPRLQRSGVGRALIENSALRLEALGFDSISLMVSEGNFRAAELYRSIGFETRFRFPVFSRVSR